MYASSPGLSRTAFRVFSLLCFAFSFVSADTIGFSSGEGYANGDLNNNVLWEAHNNSDVEVSGDATASVSPYNESRYLNPETIAIGDDFNTTIDFTFTAAVDATASSALNKDIVNASYYATDTAGDKLKIGFRRSYPGYAIAIHTTWKSFDSVPAYTGGEPSVVYPPIIDSSIGVNRDSDLESDKLRLSLSLTRGATNDDWALTGTLFNIEGGAPVQLAQLTATGITFNAGSTLTAGFGGGQSDSNSGTSNRKVDTFTAERIDNSVPPPSPLDPPIAGGTPADLNQNGIPDIAELVNPAIAEYPPAEDTDGDGASNLDEARAGTDPFDAASVFETRDMAYTVGTPDNIDFTFSSVAGVRYKVEMSETLVGGSWSTITAVVNASGEETTVSYDPVNLGVTDDRCFFRASVLPSLDTDADGLEDSLELYLGFDPNVADSVRSASEGGDYTQYYRLMTGASVDGGVFSNGVSNAGIVPSDEQASRFFSQAGFGANDDDIDQLRLLGDNAYEKWIDQQLALPASNTMTYLEVLHATREADSMFTAPPFFNQNLPHAVANNSDGSMYRRNLHTVWMRQALFAPDVLRQRVAYALGQIVVVGPVATRNARPHGVWWDILLNGCFGSYEDILYETSVNPYMGRYLSSLDNKKADPTISRMPDENYAREIMQLFSIGLWELNLDGTRRLDINGDPISTYTNEDITQVARVFTGLILDKSGGIGYANWIATHPMLMNENNHDTGDSVSVSVYGAAEKTFLQSAFYTPPSLPAFGSSSRTGDDDIRDTVNILFNHPNCPPFISKNLIQHLVTSNPSPEYVGRVAAVFVDDGTGTRGNLGAVIKAILLDKEARNFSYQLGTNHGRLKGPVLRMTTLARAFKAGSDTPSLHDLNGIQFWDPPHTDIYPDFGEFPFEYPSVFNFYEPGYARPGEVSELGLVSPEFQILNSLTSITTPNRFWSLINDGFHTISAAHTPEFALKLTDLESLASDTDALLDRLNVLFCHGTLSAETREKIKTSLDAQGSLSANEKAKLAIYLAMTTPSSAILR